MHEISISAELLNFCSRIRLGCIEAHVTVSDSSPDLLEEINDRISTINRSLLIEQISKIPAILSARKAYKACGKGPARYRLSAEALLRRVVGGKGIYQINNVVDQLNLVSISTGFSIGGYDAEQIDGDITFGIGSPNEIYHGIGKGELNIENLPVFRDKLSAFGSPTSDSQRTEVSLNTSRFLMVIIDFGADPEFELALQMASYLLKKYCNAKDLVVKYIN